MRILLRLSLAISLSLGIGIAWAAPGADHQMQARTAQGLSASRSLSGPEDQQERACSPAWDPSGPPDLTQPAYNCGRCHVEQSRRVGRSLMATASGIINQTRFLWGAQPDAGPHYAAMPGDGRQVLPTFEESGALVDDLLRRRCLRCHLRATGPARGAGAADEARDDAACAACHILRGSEQIGPDQELPGAGDAPRSPRATTMIPTSQCLRCHNGNRVGADYAGLFERDHSTSYNFEAQDPENVPHLYGHSYHFLLPDVHYERGLHCIDCHPAEEVMGDGVSHSQAQEQVGIRCRDCHGLPGQAPQTRRVTTADRRALRAARANPNYDLQVGRKVIVTSKGQLLTNTRAESGRFVLVSKVDGKKHEIPLLTREGPRKGPLDHRIPGHLKNLECATCHAAWTYQDLGLHLVRLEAADYEPWLWLTQQGDPQVKQVLLRELVKPRGQRQLPSSFDYLTGQSAPGLWLAGYSRRGWEGIVMGLNQRGLVSLLRPQFQYWVSLVDPEGRVLLDSATPTTAAGQAALAWNPYAPHTIRRQTRACWDCHGNPPALGLGQVLIRAKDGQPQRLTRPAADGLGLDFELEQVIDDHGRPLQLSTRAGAAFLDQPRLKRLSVSNPLYVKYLLKYYAGKQAYGDARGFTGPQK